MRARLQNLLRAIECALVQRRRRRRRNWAPAPPPAGSLAALASAPQRRRRRLRRLADPLTGSLVLWLQRARAHHTQQRNTHKVCCSSMLRAKCNATLSRMKLNSNGTRSVRLRATDFERSLDRNGSYSGGGGSTQHTLARSLCEPTSEPARLRSSDPTARGWRRSRLRVRVRVCGPGRWRKACAFVSPFVCASVQTAS